MWAFVTFHSSMLYGTSILSGLRWQTVPKTGYGTKNVRLNETGAKTSAKLHPSGTSGTRRARRNQTSIFGMATYRRSRRHKTFMHQNLILTPENFLTTLLVTDTAYQKSFSSSLTIHLSEIWSNYCIVVQ